MNFRRAILDSEKQLIRDFLKKFDLSYDDDIDFSLYAEENGEVFGTISSSANIIKAFAVSPNYRGQIASSMISDVINHIIKSGYNYYQVYTKTENKDIFKALNFYEIISSKNVSLLESKNRSIEKTLKKIKYDNRLDSNDTAAIVMNCNPFTLGHRYLIEEAAKQHELLIVFILEEEKSFFKFKDRFEMVKQGTNDLKNVKVVPSSGYLISSLTFPTYFLKKDSYIVNEQALLDALIFERYFIPIFNLKKRYLGSEVDLVTKKYNEVLKSNLGDFIEVVDRVSYEGDYISASRVRECLETKNFEKISHIVPRTTLEFLKKLYE